MSRCVTGLGRIRSPMLCPVELRARILNFLNDLADLPLLLKQPLGPYIVLESIQPGYKLGIRCARLP